MRGAWIRSTSNRRTTGPTTSTSSSEREAPHRPREPDLAERGGGPRLGHDFRRVGVQCKLAIGPVGDAFEQEADRVAEQVVGAPAASAPTLSTGTPRLQRACARCEEDETIRRAPEASGAGGRASGDVQAGIAQLRASGGSRLPQPTLDFMQQRIGPDFSRVRIHDGPAAARSAAALGARAYTVGSDIVFNRGQYAPRTAAGQKLIAHELTHVWQQRHAGELVQRSPEQGGRCATDEPRVCAATKCADPDPGHAGRGGAPTAWTLRVMVDIEAPTAADVGPKTTGHTYVELSDSTGRTYTYGFYPDPDKTPDPLVRELVGGCMVHPDTVHAPCVDYTETFSLTEPEFAAALAYAQQKCQRPDPYHLSTWNCTTFAAQVAKEAGKQLPPIRSRVGPNRYPADNPNQLYDELRRRDVGPVVDLKSDTQIREFVSGASVLQLRRLPTAELVRMVKRLFSGWVSDDDIAAIEKIFRSAGLEQRPTLKALIEEEAKGLNSHAQRARLRLTTRST